MGESLDVERRRVRTARTVVAQTTFALIGIVGSGLFRLSNERSTEFDLCTSTIDLDRLRDLDVEDRSLLEDLGGLPDEPVQLEVPCNQRTVSEVAGWRWPAIVSVAVALAAAGGILVATAPRWTRRTGALDEHQRPLALTGRRRGPTTRYRLMPLHSAVMTGLAVGVVGLGVGALAAAPGSVPLVILLLAVIGGGALAWASGSAAVSIDSDGLTVRTYLRRKRWSWSQIEDVRSVASTYGMGGIPSSRLVIDLTDGRSFSNESLCSTALATPTRTDQLVETIRAYRAELARP